MFNVQVHIDKESEDGQSSANPVTPAWWTWRQGESAPVTISKRAGTVAVHGSTAYFAQLSHVYSYTVSEDKWTELPHALCNHELFALAIVKDKLTTIGGVIWLEDTDSLFSLSGSSWKEVLPPMPTKRCHVTAVTTPTHLVVAGGMMKVYFSEGLSTVEVLSQETLQWSTASSLPVYAYIPQLILCGGSLYLLDGRDLFSCSVEDLLKSCKPATNNSYSGSVWTELAAVPVGYRSSLATLRGHLLSIGGSNDLLSGNPTGAIHCYNVTTNSWSVVGEMATPRSRVLAVVLSSNDLVVVGGELSSGNICSITEIGSCL